jgi:hypothetical protein
MEAASASSSIPAAPSEQNEQTLNEGNQDNAMQTFSSVTSRDPSRLLLLRTDTGLSNLPQDPSVTMHRPTVISNEEYVELGRRLCKVWELQDLREKVKSEVSRNSVDLEKVGRDIVALEEQIAQLKGAEVLSKIALDESSRKYEALEAEVNQFKRQLRLR